MDAAAAEKKQINYLKAQSELRKLKIAIEGLHELAERIEHGDQSAKAAEKPTPPAGVPLAQFLQELPKDLGQAGDSIREARIRIDGLLF